MAERGGWLEDARVPGAFADLLDFALLAAPRALAALRGVVFEAFFAALRLAAELVLLPVRAVPLRAAAPAARELFAEARCAVFRFAAALFAAALFAAVFFVAVFFAAAV